MESPRSGERGYRGGGGGVRATSYTSYKVVARYTRTRRNAVCFTHRDIHETRRNFSTPRPTPSRSHPATQENKYQLTCVLGGSSEGIPATATVLAMSVVECPYRTTSPFPNGQVSSSSSSGKRKGSDEHAPPSVIAQTTHTNHGHSLVGLCSGDPSDALGWGYFERLSVSKNQNLAKTSAMCGRLGNKKVMTMRRFSTRRE